MQTLDRKRLISLAAWTSGIERLAFPFRVLEGAVLLPARLRFQRFPAICTTGNFALPGDVKDLRAEWAAAGPFLITLWTCRED